MTTDHHDNDLTKREHRSSVLEHVGPHSDGTHDIYVKTLDPDPEYIAEGVTPEWAERIVACVNACAGMVDPSGVGAVVEALEWLLLDHSALIDAAVFVDPVSKSRAENARNALAKVRVKVKP